MLTEIVPGSLFLLRSLGMGLSTSTDLSLCVAASSLVRLAVASLSLPPGLIILNMIITLIY